MKRNRSVPLFALMLGIGAALSLPAIAFAQAPSPMANYAQTAQTPEDHEHTASLYEHHAAKADSFASNYTDRFGCIHAKSTELQRNGARFPVTQAQQYCIKLSRHYANMANENRALAEHHRNVAAQMAAMYR